MVCFGFLGGFLIASAIRSCNTYLCQTEEELLLNFCSSPTRTRTVEQSGLSYFAVSLRTVDTSISAPPANYYKSSLDSPRAVFPKY